MENAEIKPFGAQRLLSGFTHALIVLAPGRFSSAEDAERLILSHTRGSALIARTLPTNADAGRQERVHRALFVTRRVRLKLQIKSVVVGMGEGLTPPNTHHPAEYKHGYIDRGSLHAARWLHKHQECCSVNVVHNAKKTSLLRLLTLPPAKPLLAC